MFYWKIFQLQGNYEEFYSDVENKTEDPDSQENVESIDVSVDKVTGEVVTTTTQTQLDEDGSVTTIKTKEKFQNGTIWFLVRQWV